MSDITTQEINDKILDLGAQLAETRKAIPSKDALVRETEDRIVDNLAKRFQEKQDAEALERASKERDEAIMQKMDEVRVALSRIGEGKGGSEAVLLQQRQMMRSFLRSGGVVEHGSKLAEYMGGAEYRAIVEAHEIANPEKRTLSTSIATDGGYLIPPDLDTEIIRPTVNLSPVRELARVVPTTGNEYVTHDQTTYPDGEWVGETSDATADSATYGEIRIPIRTMRFKVPATEQFLDDAPSPEQEMAETVAWGIKKMESAAFVSGSGVSRPRGFVTWHNAQAAGADYILTGNDAGNNLVAADDFYDLLYGTDEATGLQDEYRANAVFGFNSNVLRKVLKLQDNGGNYLWTGEAGLQRGEPATIAGKPFRIMENMADDGTNGNNPVVVADWKRYYRIVDRLGIRVQKDPYSSFPTYIFRWVKRLGADVVQGEAGRLLVV